MYHTIHPCFTIQWVGYITTFVYFKEKMVKIYNIKFDILTTLKCVILGLLLCIHDAVQPVALFPCPPFKVHAYLF